MSEIVFKDESYEIMGAALAVYAEMGCGFQEAMYQECLAIEFEERGIPFLREVPLEICYHGRILRTMYKTDFLCHDKIMVELKALSRIVPEHRAQLLNYLHASQTRLGILFNFGHYPGLESERFLINPQRSRSKQ
jgi:GxxExxY protein